MDPLVAWITKVGVGRLWAVLGLLIVTISNEWMASTRIAISVQVPKRRRRAGQHNVVFDRDRHQ